MNVFVRTQVLIISFFALLIIYMQMRKHEKTHFIQTSLFKNLLAFEMLAILFEILTWIFDGQSGTLAHYGVVTSNTLLSLVSVIPPTIWIFYVEMQITQNEKHLREILPKILIIPGIHVVLSIATIFYGLYFYIDENNVFHRGPWENVAKIIYFSLLLYIFLLIVLNKSKMSKKHFRAMLIFLVPPLAGLIMQAMCYGTTFFWPCMTLSSLIIYLDIQSDALQTDYLTGLYNRRQLDFYLENAINEYEDYGGLAVIMMDIDNFKSINDTHGHIVGDSAIEQTAQLLRKCMPYDDFLARFAGDEFVVVCKNVEERHLQQRVQLIQTTFEHFNRVSREDYELRLSIGHVLYNPIIHKNQDQLIHEVDYLMYQSKKEKAKGYVYRT